MSLLQKLNPFHRPTPDEALLAWVQGLGARRDRFCAKWSKSCRYDPFVVKEWANPMDLQRLGHILATGPDLGRVLQEPVEQKSFPPRYPCSILEAVIGVSAQGGAMLISHGALPTQETIDTIAKLAIEYLRSYNQQTPGEKQEEPRLPFVYMDLAKSLVGVEGLKWYGTHQVWHGSSRQNYASIVAVLHQASLWNKDAVGFQNVLETEQAKRGWQVGHPPMSEWLAHKGVVHPGQPTYALARTIRGEEMLSWEEGQARILELLAMGADPCAKCDSRDDFRQKVSMVGFALQQRSWDTVHKLCNAGAPVDWEMCDDLLADWIQRAQRFNQQKADNEERGQVGWRMGELLKAVSLHCVVDWARPLPKPSDKPGYAPLKASDWPDTWGAAVEWCGRAGLRVEIEQRCLAAATPASCATTNRPRL